jgi:rhodanese-related sulfurtransferase
MYKILAIFLFFSFNLNADIGCASSLIETQNECSQERIFPKKLSALSDLDRDSKKSNSIGIVRITEDLKNLTFIYQKKEFKIERKANIKKQSCPPHCIQAMSIGDVKTVGELEVLDFIKSMQDKKGRIFVDARTVAEYKQNSIPGAINIPYMMLSPKSKHRDEVLTLLGAKKLQKKWYFRNIQKLLIFDNGILDTSATKIIENLIDVGYPQKEILYYRGGLNSWKNLGLTMECKKSIR